MAAATDTGAPTPRRLGAKFFVDPDPRASVDFDAVLALFHRFIQKGSVEGLLVDVADYAHVPDGPGVVLIGHEVDYALDRGEGRAGLLVTRKRYGDLPLAAVVRDTLRRALRALRAIEADGGSGLHFATDRAEIRFLDRLAAPNTEAAFERLRAGIEPALDSAWGPGGWELARANADDARRALAVRLTAKGHGDANALLERLERAA